MNRYLKFLYIYSLLFSLSISISNAQTSFGSESELKANATKLFEEGNYKDATPLYSQLVSNYSKDAEFNYRLGVCMLFASDDKDKPLPFLMFAASKSDVAHDVHYYLGRAYHLNYMFDDAIGEYRTFIRLEGEKKSKKYDVHRQIEMCANGKKLLNNLTDLVVMEKKELNREDFFRSYDITKIGGKLLVKPDEKEFKTSLDRKKKEQSIVYLSKDRSQIYFSSYGDKGENGKDLYILKKDITTGEWGDPIRLNTVVNTKYDEDFPFLHPNGKALYFSSKGHNSMGGYDIFKSELNEATNKWDAPVNMDFPINTPDDDILYVTDSSEKEAYFSSARSSVTGKISVYHINVERRPLDVVIVKGKFIRNNDTQSQGAKITIKDLASNAIVGIHYASAQDGSYSFEMPNGGSFSFTVETEGFPTQSDVVIVPVQYKFKPMQQKITYDVVTSSMKIVSETGEVNDDENYLFALNYIKNKSQMEVSLVDLSSEPDVTEVDELTTIATTEQIASAEVKEGKVLSNDDIVKIAYNDAEDVVEEAEELREQADIALIFANQKIELAEAKSKEAKGYIAEAANTTDINKKEELFDMADDATVEANILNKETVSAFNLAKKLDVKAFSMQEEADLFEQYAVSLDSAVNSDNPDLAMAQMEEQERMLDGLSESNQGSGSIYDNLQYEAKSKNKALGIANQLVADSQQDVAENKIMINDLKIEIDKAENDGLKVGMENQIVELYSDIETKAGQLKQQQKNVAKLKNEYNRILHEAEIVNSVIDKSKVETIETVTASIASIDKTKLEKEVNAIAEDPSLYEDVAESDNSDDALFASNTPKESRTEELESSSSTSESETPESGTSPESFDRSNSSEENEKTDLAYNSTKLSSEVADADTSETVDENTSPRESFDISKSIEESAQAGLAYNSTKLSSEVADGNTSDNGKGETVASASADEIVSSNESFDISKSIEESAQAGLASNATKPSTEVADGNTSDNGKGETVASASADEIASSNESFDISKSIEENAQAGLASNATNASAEVPTNSTLENTTGIATGAIDETVDETANSSESFDISKSIKENEQAGLASNSTNASAAVPTNNTSENTPGIATGTIDDTVDEIASSSSSESFDISKSIEENAQAGLASNSTNASAAVPTNSSSENTTGIATGTIDDTVDEIASSSESFDISKSIKENAQAGLTSNATKTTTQDATTEINNESLDYNSNTLSGTNENTESSSESFDISKSLADNLSAENSFEALGSSDLQTETGINTTISPAVVSNNQEEDINFATVKEEALEQEYAKLNRRNKGKLAAAENIENKLDRENAITNIMRNWSDDIDAYLSRQKQLFDNSTDPADKVLIADKINDAMASSKEKEAKAQKSYAAAKALKAEGVVSSGSVVLLDDNANYDAGTSSTEETLAVIDPKLAKINKDHANDLAVVDIIDDEDERKNAKAAVMKMWANEIENHLAQLEDEYWKETSVDKKKVLARKIEKAKNTPITTFVSANTISQAPVSSTALSQGDVFTLNERSVYSEKAPIPINNIDTKGLIYKVQIGAFRKPIPQDLFEGINPITGETTSKGFIRYTAGIFKEISTAQSVKQEIRNLGYKDAFVVAFKNGKRISMKRANAIASRQSGSSKTTPQSPATEQTFSPVSAEELQKRFTDIGSINNKTIATKSTVENSGTSEATATSKSENIENVKGLFYTVQVGVFSKPVSAKKLFNVQPLYTETAPNGNLRYNIGIYSSLSRAREANTMVVDIGIGDAYVTAYYNGKRISVNEAKLIELSGDVESPKVSNANRRPYFGTASASATTSLKAVQKKTVDDQIYASTYSKGVVYKVQVGAFRYEVPIKIVNNFLNISAFGIENYKAENGLTVFTAGEYKTYKEAGAAKAKILAEGFEGAFIVAYRNGKKVPVLELNK